MSTSPAPGGDGQQRVIAPLAGIAVVACATYSLASVTVGLEMVELEVDHRRVAGIEPQRTQARASSLRRLTNGRADGTMAHTWKLTHGRCPSGWRLDRAAQAAGRPLAGRATHRRRQCSRRLTLHLPPALILGNPCSVAPWHGSPSDSRPSWTTRSGNWPRCRPGWPERSPANSPPGGGHRSLFGSGRGGLACPTSPDLTRSPRGG